MGALRRELTADVADIVNDVLGEAVSYTPKGGSAKSITGVFRDAAERLEVGPDGMPVATFRPLLRVWQSDVSTPGEGDTFTLGAKSYRVVEVEKTGHDSADCYAVEV